MHYPHPKPSFAADACAKEEDASTGKAQSLKYKGSAKERRTD